MSQRSLTIGSRRVGPGQPVFVIAEIGMNHNGDLDLALAMIEAAGACGVDAVKFQSFRTEAFLSDRIPGLDDRRRYEIPEAWYPELNAAARQAGVEFFSTPLDAGSAETLAANGVPCFKIASCDLTNLPLIAQVAGYGKPVIISTGFGRLGEVERAIETALAAGNRQLILMHCVALYPTPPGDANLRAIETLRQAFGLPVGLSDHSREEPAIALLAAGLGAVALEKHFTTDRALPGYDHAMSETPESLTQIVSALRQVPAILGDGRLERSEAELARRETARRGLYWTGDLEAGTRIEAAHLIPLRPSHAVAPCALPELLGRTLQRPVKGGDPVARTDLHAD